MKYSLTYAGAIVMFLSMAGRYFNLEFPYTEAQISDALYILVGVISFLATLYGRFRAGGVNLFGIK